MSLILYVPFSIFRLKIELNSLILRYLSSSDCNKQRKQTIFGTIPANNIGAINSTGIADIIGVEEVQDLELNMEMFLRREGEPIYLFYF